MKITIVIIGLIVGAFALIAWGIFHEVKAFCREKEQERIDTDGKPLKTYRYVTPTQSQSPNIGRDTCGCRHHEPNRPAA